MSFNTLFYMEHYLFLWKLLDSYQFGVATNGMTSQRYGIKDLIDFKTSDAFVILYPCKQQTVMVCHGLEGNNPSDDQYGINHCIGSDF